MKPVNKNKKKIQNSSIKKHIRQLPSIQGIGQQGGHSPRSLYNPRYKTMLHYPTLQIRGTKKPTNNGIGQRHAAQVRNNNLPARWISQSSIKIIAPVQQSQFSKKNQTKFPQKIVSPKIRRRFPHLQGIQNTHSNQGPFSNSKTALNMGRQFSNTIPAQHMGRQFPKAIHAQHIGRQFPKTIPAQHMGRQFLKDRTNQKIRKPFYNAKMNLKVQKPRRPILRATPNKRIPKGAQQNKVNTHIKIFTPQELLKLVPQSDKNLWESIISRLPQDYTIPDIKFINLFKAFNREKR